MNEKNDRRGPSRAWLLLIPAAVILAKRAARRRRAMWASGWGEARPAGRGFSYRHGFGGAEAEGDPRAAFRLPPKIEWMLDTWHARAHEAAAGATEPSTSPGATTV